MKINILSLSAIVTVLGSTSLLAATPSQTANVQAPASTFAQIQTIEFRNSPEEGMMHKAYRILASGDHDYHGHRIAAMHEIHKAADLLGVDLTGDDKDREKQFLSDDRLREARGLLKNVLGNSEVKGQDRISHHIELAIREIDLALRNH
ncbi:MAG TPA: hypothetical protein VMF08_00265 [Candidatus Sulfotelmatobacter sp.]|nr:hypothetical protein [Candidatus Sulfotelmatobacter sp.]